MSHRRQPTPICEIADLLQTTFGHRSFRPLQEEVCRSVTEGSDVLLVMPTGAGKSLCFQLPALVRHFRTGALTVVISPLQALMAAKAGATYVSPFVGRLDDLSQEGLLLVEQIVEIYSNYAYDSEIIVASVRNPLHVLESAVMGADIATLPLSVLKKLAAHPMTDKGIKAFLSDWEKAKK
jgi:superfamily II DNA or RNA helicase